MAKLPRGGDFDVVVKPIGTAKPSLRTPQDRVEEDLQGTDTLAARLMAAGVASGTMTTVVTTHVPSKAETDAGDVVKGYTVPMPKRVKRAVDVRSTEDGRSIKYYVLLGLQMQGFPVRDEDLEDNRGSFLKKVAAARRRNSEE
jgi:hypothetical protein